MSQHDYVIANGTGAAVRSDLNGALAAIVSNNSGATAPSTTYAYQWWADTTTGLLKLRNAANNAWITLFQLDGEWSTLAVENGSASAPSIYFKDSGTDTGIYSSGTDAVDIATAGTRRLGVASNGDITFYGGNITLNAQGDLRFADSDSSNWVAFQAPATVASNVTWTLPAADGTSAQVLSTNGSGTLSWASVSSDKISEGNTEAEVVDTGSDGHFKVTTEGSERLRVDPSGRLLVGTSTATAVTDGNVSAQVEIEGTTTATSAISIIRNSNDTNAGGLIIAKSRGTTAGSNTLVSSGDSLGFIQFQGADGTQKRIGASIDAVADAATGANDLPTRLVLSTCPDGSATPVERMRINNAGKISINNTTGDSGNTGFITNTGGDTYITAAGVRVLYVNRKSDDGVIVSLRQDDIEEGTISVSGTTVSYNGAHLSRWSQLPGIDPHDKDQRPEILRGTVMSNLDEMCDWIDPESGDAQDNEQLNKTKISDVEGDKNVAGIFQSWDNDDDTWVNDYYLAMTGDFIIRIAEGVTVERGDLLMSAGDGTAKPQDDDIIRSKTIAKVTSTNVSCTYDDGSYCVPCVLMAC